MPSSRFEVSFAVERIGNWVPEAVELLAMEHEERGLDLPLEINADWYLNRERADSLVPCIARAGGKVVGWIVYLLGEHPHYKQLAAEPDIFYVDPEWRGAQVGRCLLDFAEEVLRKRGVRILFARVPSGARHGLLYERRGFKPAETLYVKLL